MRELDTGGLATPKTPDTCSTRSFSCSQPVCVSLLQGLPCVREATWPLTFKAQGVPVHIIMLRERLRIVDSKDDKKRARKGNDSKIDMKARRSKLQFDMKVSASEFMRDKLY